MYTIKEVSLASGLTERTLRNYLKIGVLKGEKINGVWRFTPEQLTAFFENDYVKPAIQANRRSILFDYLNNAPKDKNSACILLHLPKENAKEVSSFFCDAINKRTGVQMTFDNNKGMNKIMLLGDVATVLSILNDYSAIK